MVSMPWPPLPSHFYKKLEKLKKSAREQYIRSIHDNNTRKERGR